MNEVTLQAYVSSKTTHNGGGGEEVKIVISQDNWAIGETKILFQETSPLELAKYEITFKKLD